MSKTKERDSNIELLRIIAMLFIVAGHYVHNSGLLDLMYKDSFSFNSSFLFLWGGWGKTAINIFALISGYYMCTKSFSKKRFVKILSEVLFYNITICAIFCLIGKQEMSFSGLLFTISPIKSIRSDFVSCFIVFMLLVPYINIFCNSIQKDDHIRITLILIFVYSILGSIPSFPVQFNYVTWFFILFLCAVYIRKYPDRVLDNQRFWGLMSLFSLILAVASIFVCLWISQRTGRNNAYFFIIDSNKILSLVVSLSVFNYFRLLEIGKSKVINTIAASTFGVLLIHANSDAMRDWLWKDTLNNIKWFSSKYMVLHFLLSVIGVFSICILIDYLRINIVKKCTSLKKS